MLEQTFAMQLHQRFPHRNLACGMSSRERSLTKVFAGIKSALKDGVAHIMNNRVCQTQRGARLRTNAEVGWIDTCAPHLPCTILSQPLLSDMPEK
jgi:hypothetical protein